MGGRQFAQVLRLGLPGGDHGRQEFAECCSSRADGSRLNRGYAVRSIEVTRADHPTTRQNQPIQIDERTSRRNPANDQRPPLFGGKSQLHQRKHFPRSTRGPFRAYLGCTP